MALVDGVSYRRLGDDHYYAQELFEQEDLIGHLKNMIETNKSVFEHVVHDSSNVEKTFAEDLEKNESVKVYAKLPTWFSVPTPLGGYRPDWAVLVEVDGTERLYFVVETKGSFFDEDIRFTEAAKIACGKAHFQSLNGEHEPPQLIKATSVADLMQHCSTPLPIFRSSASAPD